MCRTASTRCPLPPIESGKVATVSARQPPALPGVAPGNARPIRRLSSKKPPLCRGHFRITLVTILSSDRRPVLVRVKSYRSIPKHRSPCGQTDVARSRIGPGSRPPLPQTRRAERYQKRNARSRILRETERDEAPGTPSRSTPRTPRAFLRDPLRDSVLARCACFVRPCAPGAHAWRSSSGRRTKYDVLQEPVSASPTRANQKGPTPLRWPALRRRRERF